MRKTAATIALFAVLTGTAQATEPLHLPTPAGRFPVGTTEILMVDHSRPDPWDQERKCPDGQKCRKVMTTVYYPARDVEHSPLAPYMGAGAAAVFGSLDAMLHKLPGGVDWAATTTAAHTGAPARPGRRPVLLYSPGLGDPRVLGTGLATDLASRGYVVVTIDHPGETSEVDIPGEGTRIIGLPGDPSSDPGVYRTAIDTRLRDTKFVLAQLPKVLPFPVDLRRVGMYGHGLGGTTAAEALHDRIVDAAVNMDGFLDYHPTAPGRPGELLPIAAEGTNRPLLLWGSEGFRNPRNDRSWAATLAHSRGCTTREELTGAAHWTFTDYGALAPQLAMSAEDRTALIGSIDPTVSVPTVRTRIARFFTQHL
ncbi:alpha/beta hydrolase [Actinocrispum sp. NPDC049592]|uniref:alpha/beta hydrolase family protein n=1 Tax=Actinocrispum sp. NPDC049592 TaxID=3154835 RepID=UPI003444F93C